VFIPLLAFDKSGHRVGYGAGYYDRFLSKCKPDCLKVGLSFFEPVDEISDADEFDVKLNHCVTPSKIWTF
jgi:5-formyltetrahydrofolate cyclo-ligase